MTAFIISKKNIMFAFISFFLLLSVGPLFDLLFFGFVFNFFNYFTFLSLILNSLGLADVQLKLLEFV